MDSLLHFWLDRVARVARRNSGLAATCYVTAALSLVPLAAVASVPPAPVDETTTSVAVLPRPVTVVVPPKTNCPQDDPGLTTLDPAWLAPDGTLAIPAGVRALLSGNLQIPATTLIEELNIPSGSELVIDDLPTVLRIRDLKVAGALRIGSSSCRSDSDIRIVFDTNENLTDPLVLDQIHARRGLGMVVEPGGVLELFGRLHQPTWTRLAVTAAADTAWLTLAEPVDWLPGQQVVVVTSAMRDYPYMDQNEVRTIVSVDGSGTGVALDLPLTYNHYGGPEYQVEVGLLSHNIVLETESSLRSAAPTFGGHVMSQSADARISGVELRRLGQQNFLGRYPFHLHHAGDVAGQAYLADSSIHDSNWRCAVVHRSDNAVLSRNVAYDAWGHCFYLEDGVEQGNEISYNLAARVKIMGPVDQTALFELDDPSQTGFVLLESSEFANPADRAAAGFYITNGNNPVFGNAASGGFTGYTFPNLPEPTGTPPLPDVPMNVPISSFDGNTAHTSGYFWREAGCVYVGGTLMTVDDGGVPKLQYHSGRPAPSLLRDGPDTFTNLKTFLCQRGLTHWGRSPGVVNLESWDNGMMAQVFGEASIQSAVVAVESGNTSNLAHRNLGYYRRGFRFYDTATLTILRDIVFRNFVAENPDPGAAPSADNCVFLTLTHSDEFTPQRMLAMSGIYFDNIDDTQRFCHDDTGKLSSLNFNLVDDDGSTTGWPGDGLPAGARIVGSGYTDAWKISAQCVRHDDWKLWICPATGPELVASVRTTPNQGVQVVVYRPDGSVLGDTGYATGSEFAAAQITAPSELIWHHTFPSGIPRTIDLHALQVPEGSFLIYSLSLPVGVSCAVNDAGWAPVANLATLLASNAAVYTTENRTCFARIPQAFGGYFSAAGMSIPHLTWPGMSTLSDFTITTGCTGANLACQDTDGDGIDDAIETLSCTDPLDTDSDDDGLGDGAEDTNGDGFLDPWETDPCNADTDGDGLQDGTELGVVVALSDPDGIAPMSGSDPGIFVPDPDPGSLSDPLLADTDGDGVGDASDPTPGDFASCGDSDLDGCDDCTFGQGVDPANDGGDVDADGVCDRSDLDDGLIVLGFSSRDLLFWQLEQGVIDFDVYRGDLALLPEYTQDLGSDAAEQFCSAGPILIDTHLPPAGEAVFYLVADPVDDDLGQDSSGAVRPNTAACGSDLARVIFVTSVNVPDGNLGGLAGADAFCQNLADNAGLSGSYRAWLSNFGTDARDRMTQFPGPYRLVDGTQIASSFADLIDCPAPYVGCSLDNPIDIDENGNARGLAFAYTGTFPDGTGDDTYDYCSDWTATVQSARSGRSDRADFGWTACCVIACNSPGPLYCVEQ